jgi:hypothetical protein
LSAAYGPAPAIPLSSHFVEHLECSLMNLHHVFLDMAALVEVQGHQLNDLRILTLPIQSIRQYHNHELGGKRRETRRGWQQEAPSDVVVRRGDSGRF